MCGPRRPRCDGRGGRDRQCCPPPGCRRDRGPAWPPGCLDQLRRQWRLWPLRNCSGGSIRPRDRRDLWRHRQWLPDCALALMRPQESGTIVNVCSAVAFHGLPLMTSYSGAKAAVRGFVQALRAELAIERSPIRVSAVFPPGGQHAVFLPFHFAYGMARPPGAARLSAGGRRCRRVPGGNRHGPGGGARQRHGGSLRPRDPALHASDRLPDVSSWASTANSPAIRISPGWNNRPCSPRRIAPPRCTARSAGPGGIAVSSG